MQSWEIVCIKLRFDGPGLSLTSKILKLSGACNCVSNVPIQPKRSLLCLETAVSQQIHNAKIQKLYISGFKLPNQKLNAMLPKMGKLHTPIIRD